MLYRGPMGAGAASGKMGAMVAARNKGGQYLRARVVPSGRVASEFQQPIRNALASLVTQWNSELTQEQRDGWGTYALGVRVLNRLGDSIQLSGQNWFIACNTPRLQAEIAVILDAPTTFDRGTVLIPGLSGTIAGGNIIWSSSGTVTGPCDLLFYQGQPFSAGRNKYYGSFRYIQSTHIGTVGITGGTLTPVLPLPADGSKGVLRITATQPDGRLSTPLDATFLGV